MARVLIPSPLKIPTVTQEDLYTFHARVFESPAPGQLFRTEQETYNDPAHEEVFQAENDALGYYPDGAKRTLTDDQIAMFRHSEIYAILRERQVRKENLEAEGDEQSETMLSPPEEFGKATTLSDEEGEVQSDGEVRKVFATVAEDTPQHVDAPHPSKKRKRGDTDTGYVHGRKYASRSARGFVRELDSAAAEDQILDYGDEASINGESKQIEMVATKVAGQGHESQAHPAKGKKIWWPIIEAH